jgi:glyceraldehyde-3-phosphate dehydrogenase (NADP+)
MGPFNYPFNETYTTFIPALIMGNCVVLKLPRTGVLCHYPTFEVFQKVFPPGVVNIIAGAGRSTVPAIMQSGKLDCFAFIGTSKAADELQKAHPKPHRLRICLGLEAKNPAIVSLQHNLIDKVASLDNCSDFARCRLRCNCLRMLVGNLELQRTKMHSTQDSIRVGLSIFVMTIVVTKRLLTHLLRSLQML